MLKVKNGFRQSVRDVQTDEESSFYYRFNGYGYVAVFINVNTDFHPKRTVILDS